MQNEIDSILYNQSITPYFQPIVSLRDGSILGYEALSRISQSTTIDTIEQLFILGDMYNKTWDLEQLCRKKALSKVFKDSTLPYTKKLFLNVSPLIISDINFSEGFTIDYLKRYNANPNQIVFEITERETIKNMDTFQKLIAHYKNQNYQIAIDDVGSGYSGLNLICDVVPHYIKLDIKLIENIDTNSVKYAVVKSLMELYMITNINIIAEGIETKKQLEILINIGIPYGQGYYLGHPDVELHTVDVAIVNTIKDMNRKKAKISIDNTDKYYINSICTNGMAVPHDIKIDKLLSYFISNSKLSGVCIQQGNRIIGILTREKLQNKLSGRFGFSLCQNKEVTYIMDRNFLSVDYQMPINTVSKEAMQRNSDNLYDFIVVTKNDIFYGIVIIKDLLIKATEIDIDYAKTLNPLTSLPGNTMIDAEIHKCITTYLQYTIMYVDLDNFKAFNDVYGFEMGDRVILLLSDILKEFVSSDDFIGHVGGDDFVVILRHYDHNNIRDTIMSELERRARLLYTISDRERGYIISKSRNGNQEHFPLLTVTIALCTNQDKNYLSAHELSELLAHDKKQLKLQKASS